MISFQANAKMNVTVAKISEKFDDVIAQNWRVVEFEYLQIWLQYDHYKSGNIILFVIFLTNVNL